MEKIKTGSKFGYLMVINSITNEYKKNRYRNSYLCLCDCGKSRIFQPSQLATGHNYSCGCKKGLGNLIHGMTDTIFYRKWDGMFQRCNNKNKDNYHRYGGRGIKIEWKNFKEFKSDMYQSYLIHTEKFGILDTTIDRINPNGNYSTGNCRWATMKEQGRNRTNNIWIEFEGKKITTAEFSELIGISKSVVSKKVKKGYSATQIISEKGRVNQYA